MESIQRVCTLLGRSPLTVQEAAAELGQLIEDQGENLALVVKPVDPTFAEAEVRRVWDTETTAHIMLIPADPSALTVAALAGTFGEYNRMRPTHRGALPELRFMFGELGEPGACSILATVQPGAEGIRDGTVVEVVVQPEF